MSLFQDIRDGNGPDFKPLKRSLWRLTGWALYFLLILSAAHSAWQKDYARAAYEMALAVSIQLYMLHSSLSDAGKAGG